VKENCRNEEQKTPQGRPTNRHWHLSKAILRKRKGEAGKEGNKKTEISGNLQRKAGKGRVLRAASSNWAYEEKRQASILVETEGKVGKKRGEVREKKNAT